MNFSLQLDYQKLPIEKSYFGETWLLNMSLKMRKNRGEKPPEPCMLTECMAVISGAWAPNVIWCLRAGPRRFSELRADIPPISAKVLSTRLSELEDKGVLLRHVRRTSPPSTEYELTPLGAELLPALDAIVQVGHRLKSRRLTTGRPSVSA